MNLTLKPPIFLLIVFSFIISMFSFENHSSVYAALPVVQLDSQQNVKVTEYTGNTNITLSGTVLDASNHSVTISATINGKLKSTVINNTSTQQKWLLKWDTMVDNIAAGSYKDIVVSANDGVGGVSTTTYTGYITVEKVDTYSAQKDTIQFKNYTDTSWKPGSATSYENVEIPDGFKLFGVDNTYFYVFNPITGAMKIKDNAGTTWNNLSGWSNTTIPSGFVPFGTDGVYFYVMNISTGDMLIKKADYTYWEDANAYYKDVTIPADYLPLGINNQNAYIIHSPTGAVKMKSLLANSWLNWTAFPSTPLPTGYIPFGINNSIVVISNYNINAQNDGVSNIGRYLTYDLKDASNNPITKITAAETSKVVYLKGNYEVGSMIGEDVTVRYAVHAKNAHETIQEGIIQNTFTINNTNKNGSFNKAITFKTSGTCLTDEVCLPNSSSSFYVRVYIDYTSGSDKQVLSQFSKTITLERTPEPYKNVLSDTALATEQGHFKMNVKDLIKGTTLIGNEYFTRANLKTAKQGFEIDGHVRVSGNVGKDVKIRYDLIDYDSYLNTSKLEGLISSFTQTSFTSGNYIKFNRKFDVKVTSGELPSSVDYNLIPDENRDYVIRVVVEVNGVTTYLEDIPIHVSNATSGTPTGDVGTGFHQTIPLIPNGEKVAYTLKRGATNFTTIPLTDIRNNRIQLDLFGTFKDSGIPIGTNVKLRYKLTSIDNAYYASEEQLIQEYNQTTFTNANNTTFNKHIYLKSEANPVAQNPASPTIHLKDYPARYTFLVEAVYGTNEAVAVQKVIEFEVTGTNQGYFNVNGSVPPFPDKTNLEFKVSKFTNPTTLSEIANTETNQTTVPDILVTDIRTTPLKLNIDGSFTNKIDASFDDILIQYDIMALENYSDQAGVNKVVKRIKESVHTEGRTVEFNRNFWLSTEDRANKTSDIKDDTIYVENYTQYYTVRVSALNKSTGTTVVLRDIKIHVKASEIAYQTKEGPTFTLPDGLSTYFFDTSGNRVETLEITARDLNNATNGIDVDIQGFFKTNWIANQNINITYELEALNSYKDYIKNPSGIEETLELDYDDQINGKDPIEYQSRIIPGPMEEWLDGKTTQTGTFKWYTNTDDTRTRHEPFTRKLTLRTKLDKGIPEVASNESVLYLDNMARSYKLRVYAKNMTTNEIVEKIINLKITTIKPNGTTVTNTKPAFDSGVGVFSPSTGTGWFVEETMPIKWKPATDADNELMYYKIYYYYTTTDASGTVNQEIRNYLKRYEDYPKSGNDLAYDYVVDNPAKIEPVNIRVLACDVNHECSAPTRSNPFKLNEFGVQQGGGGGGGVTANISIYPKPDGQWKNQDIELSVMYDGDPKLLEGAVKRYSITNNATFPGSLANSLASNGLINLSNAGSSYVHVSFELSNGMTVSTTAGPYKIDKSALDGLTVKLVNDSGVEVTDWTNINPTLVITPPTTVGVSATNRQYMIEGYHSDWQPYRDGIKIALDGQYRVFARAVNQAGTFSEQQYATAKIDKIKPEFDNLTIHKLEDGRFEVTARTYENESGVNYVILNTGTKLDMNGSPSNFIKRNIASTSKPTSIQAVDKAGNTSVAVTFLDLPTVNFQNSYTPTQEISRQDVSAQVNGTGVLSYKLGSRTYGCVSAPCDVTINKNSLFTAYNKKDYQTASAATSIGNIDKTPIRLVLNAERDVATSTKITFAWNYQLTGGKIVCTSPSGNITQTVSNSSLSYVYNSAQNASYQCQIEGTIYGELVKSNTITVYPDYLKEQAVISGPNAVTEKTLSGGTNIYFEESRLGDSYFVNTRRQNTTTNKAPIPDDIY